jgi:thymidine phosphorylase
MDQPLGCSVGNALEVAECIGILKNQVNPDLCSGDLKELTIQLCAHMLHVGGVVRNVADGRKLAHTKLADGSAWKVFENLVVAQKGSVQQILNPRMLPHTAQTVVWKAKKRGYIAKMNTETIGKILVELGGGRKKASDPVDPAVGMIFHAKLGARVQNGSPIVTVHHSFGESSRLEELEEMFQDAIEITAARKPVPKLIFEQF